jgi:cation diffusion facilitator family transporter
MFGKKRTKATHDNRVHEHDLAHGVHGHVHGVVDPSIITTQRGIWAVKWSFLGLTLTSLIQVAVVVLSGSAALMADTFHNIGDALTAVPLWMAFRLTWLKPTKRFTYGFGRVEDLAGVAIVFIILLSAIGAGYESMRRLLSPQEVNYLGAVVAASLVGFVGNEAVATFRIRVGREIRSAALVADGYHARVDGLTSLGVLAGTIGVWLGYPAADPIVGLLITLAIVRIVWQSAKSVFTRLLDGVDPEVIEEIKHAVAHLPQAMDVSEVRVRWLGHRLYAEASISVADGLSVEEGHEVAREVRHRLLHHLAYLSHVTIHVDPQSTAGEEHHAFLNHAHDDMPNHSHT